MSIGYTPSFFSVRNQMHWIKVCTIMLPRNVFARIYLMIRWIDRILKLWIVFFGSGSDFAKTFHYFVFNRFEWESHINLCIYCNKIYALAVFSVPKSQFLGKKMMLFFCDCSFVFCLYAGMHNQKSISSFFFFFCLLVIFRRVLILFWVYFFQNYIRFFLRKLSWFDV